MATPAESVQDAPEEISSLDFGPGQRPSSLETTAALKELDDACLAYFGKRIKDLDHEPL